MTGSERTTKSVNVNFGEVPVHTGFRVKQASEFAGGPIELEFFAEVTGPKSLYLTSFGDRMRHRARDFSFDATFAGVSLGDPFAHLPDIGGPGGILQVNADSPLVQPLILNQYVRLEDTVNLLAPLVSDQLLVTCSRTLAFGRDEEEALSPKIDPLLAQVQLAFELRRDDAGLVALVEQLISQVQAASPAQRERPLTLLLALRAPIAVARWRTLVNHPDPLVAERVKEALWMSGL